MKVEIKATKFERPNGIVSWLIAFHDEAGKLINDMAIHKDFPDATPEDVARMAIEAITSTKVSVPL